MLYIWAGLELQSLMQVYYVQDNHLVGVTIVLSGKLIVFSAVKYSSMPVTND